MKKSHLFMTACAIAALGVGAVAFAGCGDTVKAHEHQWESAYVTVKRPTCSEEGLKVRKCTYPGCTAEDTLPVEKLAHTPGSTPEDTATCTEGGHLVWTCTVCGEKEEGSPTQALGHNYEAGKVIERATCLAGGKTEYVCSRCSDTQVRDTDQLQHSYQRDSAKSEPSTCSKAGKIVYTCINGCEQSRTEDLPLLDHTIKYETKEDPTFEKDGHYKGECTVCGTPIDVTLPKLVDGAQVEFTFKLRKNGENFSGVSSMRFVVTDQDGKEVSIGNISNYIAGEYRVKLPIHPGTEYTLSVKDTPGYYMDDLTLTPANPSGTIEVEARLIGEDEHVSGTFGLNGMVQDFRFTDLNGEEVHFAEVLKKNKAVMINFFFSSCPGCVAEARYLADAYKNKKDQGIEVIGITTDVSESYRIENVKSYCSTYGVTYPVYYEERKDTTTQYIYQKYGVKSFPTSIFIDHEGFIVLTPQPGGYGQDAFEYWFDIYTSTTWDDMEEGGQGFTVADPEEQPDGLTISVLRGDYLPAGDEE